MVVLSSETIGGATLYQADMREVLPLLDERAHLLATDPPYRLTSGGQRASMSGKLSPERYDNSGYLMDVLPWHEMAGPLFRACHDDADAYVLCNDKHVCKAQTAFEAAGWRFNNLLSWDKGAPTRTPFYMKNQEYGLYLWRGRARRPNCGGVKQKFECPRPSDVDWHPTAKPLALMSLYILQSSDPGDLVLDPFMGSGSTVIAALAFGRRAVGVEACAEYFDQACARIEAAQAAGFADVYAEWEAARVANNIKGLAHAA